MTRSGAGTHISSARTARFVSALWPVAVFTVLTAIMTWPLITDLPHSIIYGITADADQGRWSLWWVKTALLDRHTNPFYTDMLYYPYHQGDHALPLYYHTLQPFNGLLALPILLLNNAVVGPTLAFNLLVLFHFALAGCAMFWLVRYLTGSAAGGLIAGALYTFGPFHQYHLHEAQMELIPIGWLPLFLLFLHRFLYVPTGAARRPRDAVLAVLFLVITTFTSWYWTLYLLIAAALLVLVRLLERPRQWRPTLLGGAAVLLAWALLVSPFLLATIRTSTDPTFTLVSGIDYEVRFSLSPMDLLTVSKDARMNPPVWFMGPLTYTALALGALGAARLRRRGAFWLLLLATGAILALGPYLTWGSAYDVGATTGIPLPYLLVRNLPFLSIARVPRRLVLLADIGLDVLASAGAAVLVNAARAGGGALRRAPVGAGLKPAPTAGVPGTLRAGATAVVLLALALAEVAVIPQPLHPVTISPFFTQLAAQPGDFGILELPVTTHYLRDHARMLNETVSGKPIIGGYISRQVRDPYLTADSPFYPFIKLAPRPPPDILPPLSPFAVLNYYHIPYIVVYKNDESYVQPSDRAAVDAYVQALYPTGVGVVYDDAQLTAYRVPTIPADAPLLWAGDGWYAPETQHGQTWRWSNGRQADLHVLSPIPLTWPLRFRAASFHSPARLTITLNGHALQTVELGADLAAYDLGALTLPPGETVINFTSDAPPGATTGRDARPLGFTLRDLTTPGVRVIVLQRGGGRT